MPPPTVRFTSKISIACRHAIKFRDMGGQISRLWRVLVSVSVFKFLRFGVVDKLKKKEKRKLLVLDLNGILVDVVDSAPKGYAPDIRIRRKPVFKRPFCDDFLKFCFEHFDVVIWTSRMKKNVDGLIGFVLGDLKHQVLLIWDQSQCTELKLKISQTGLQTKENRCKPVFLKELKKVWDIHGSSLPWANGQYNESNTLLLDDSPYKAILNPPHTAVFPETYSYKHENDNSLGPGGDIRVYLEGLAVAENVQIYVEQHPFGQDPIAPSSQLYRKVINSINRSKITNHRDSQKWKGLESYMGKAQSDTGEGISTQG